MYQMYQLNIKKDQNKIFLELLEQFKVLLDVSVALKNMHVTARCVYFRVLVWDAIKGVLFRIFLKNNV